MLMLERIIQSKTAFSIEKDKVFKLRENNKRLI